ncbi:MAG: hypothetical protein GY906_39320 [bacterium]|nr:hypothetical protein [bacterium]
MLPKILSCGASFLVVVIASVALASAQVVLEADFNDKTLDAAIGVGGAALGEPIHVDSAVIATVRSGPFASPSLEISDNNDYYSGSVRFEFLDQQEISSGSLTLSAELWFPAFENFYVSVRERGTSACNMLSLGFYEAGTAQARDGDSIGGHTSYSTGRAYPIQVHFDLDAGTYDLFLDGSLIASDEAHGESGCGIGAFLFGTGHDGDLDGRFFVDNIRVAIGGNSVQERPLHATGQVIAQVAHVRGFGSSYWTSQLTVGNPSASEILTDLYYTPRGANGATDFQRAQMTLAAGECRNIEDVVVTTFASAGAGSLEVVSPVLVVSSRTMTSASGGGAYGHGMVPIGADQVMKQVHAEVHGVGVIKGEGARSNLALNEVWGESARVEVTLMNRLGEILGQREYDLAPYSNHQINDLVYELAQLSSLNEGQVRVKLLNGPGRIAATLFVVDASDDPSTVPLYLIQ